MEIKVQKSYQLTTPTIYNKGLPTNSVTELAGYEPPYTTEYSHIPWRDLTRNQVEDYLEEYKQKVLDYYDNVVGTVHEPE